MGSWIWLNLIICVSLLWFCVFCCCFVSCSFASLCCYFISCSFACLYSIVVHVITVLLYVEMHSVFILLYHWFLIFTIFYFVVKPKKESFRINLNNNHVLTSCRMVCPYLSELFGSAPSEITLSRNWRSTCTNTQTCSGGFYTDVSSPESFLN